MRRRELASREEDVFRELAAEVMVGYLGLVTADGVPRSIALNFAAIGHDIYFHGALAGEKFELLQRDPPAGFTIVKPYSYIPSYWSAPRFACPATHFFKSVEIKGTCGQVEDLAAKAGALQALMRKHQPEGRHDTIDPTVPQYAKALAHVGVFRLRCGSWTGKVKFGQNEPEKLRRVFVEELRRRGGPMDVETAAEIEQTFTA
jgi:nitroimidazol reductase NimA-like FMN-containing flavoprotein (pyridoxamine 5'-phosphate oxidase superfamily)